MTRMMITLTVLATLSVLAACGEGSEPDSTAASAVPGSDEVVAIGSDPRIMVHDLMVLRDMKVGGRLAYDQDGKCFLVHGKRGEESFTAAPVWPKGTKPLKVGDLRGVRVPGFGDIQSGDMVSAGGHYWPAGQESLTGVIDSACVPKDGFIVLNPESFRA